MPNHCANQLTVKGSADQVAAFRAQAKGEKEVFDLNKFIPMPEELRGTEAPNRDAAQAAALKEKYGAADWHIWTLNNWGTKWGCYEGEVFDEGEGYVTYLFYTAWEPVGQSALQAMSEGYPDLLFNLTFAERLMDFWGEWDAAEGDIVGEGGGDGIAGVSSGGVYGVASESAETIQLLASISG